MVVKIDRYAEYVYHGEGTIRDLLHNEVIVEISTKNRDLTQKLIDICMEELNRGAETNDRKPRGRF